LKKGKVPEIFLTELEDNRISLEALGFSIADDQFMIHIFNSMHFDYDLQIAIMESASMT
jgi:hypothetical protein